MSTQKEKKNNVKVALKPFVGEVNYGDLIKENFTLLNDHAIKIPGKKNQVLVKAGSAADTEILSLSESGQTTALGDITIEGADYRLCMVSDPLFAKAK